MLPDEKRLRKQVLKRFKNKPEGYYFVTNYVHEKFFWMGVVLEKKGQRLIILSVGVELTQDAIKQWGAGVIANRKLGKPPKDDPPDMAERSRMQ